MPIAPLRMLSVDEFLQAGEVILIDCEFTCWEDSLCTWWADPRRPPEVIEIGLARYAFDEARAADTFTDFVRPRLNPRLSAYCRDLLGLAQETVDAAPLLTDVAPHLSAWLDRLPPGVPTCGWGTIDREFVAADAGRAGLPCPFAARPHADVRALCERVLGRDPGSRDALRVDWKLAPNPRRHRALDDALDAAQFGVVVRARASRTWSS